MKPMNRSWKLWALTQGSGIASDDDPRGELRERYPQEGYVLALFLANSLRSVTNIMIGS
jgi:hypothetical protein